MEGETLPRLSCPVSVMAGSPHKNAGVFDIQRIGVAPMGLAIPLATLPSPDGRG